MAAVPSAETITQYKKLFLAAQNIYPNAIITTFKHKEVL